MARSESFLRAAALEMEAWETQGHSNEPFLIGGTDVEGTPSWEDRDEDEEDARRRRAGVRHFFSPWCKAFILFLYSSEMVMLCIILDMFLFDRCCSTDTHAYLSLLCGTCVTLQLEYPCCDTKILNYRPGAEILNWITPC